MTARRRGGVPPLVTVLITLSAIVAAGLVAWFLFTTTNSAVKTPLLEVTSAYALCSSSGTTTSCTVYITLRNVGGTDVTISGNPTLEVTTSSGTTTFSTTWTLANSTTTPVTNRVIQAGTSLTIRGSGTTNIPDGTSAMLTLTVTPAGGYQQTVSLGFKIARP
jgi:hypothetical protein